MPLKPSKPCKYPGCPGITREANGFCSIHQQYAANQQRQKQKMYDAKRGSSSNRGYDAAWRKLRIAVKERDQWLCVCSRCKAMGRIKPVTKTDPVHHILPVETHPHLRLSMDNCESYSFKCHEVEEGRARDIEYESWLRNREGGIESLQPSACRPDGQLSVRIPK